MYWGVALVILVGAFAVQLAGARLLDLGVDGGMAISLAHAGLEDTIAFFLVDAHPPLFYVMLHFWMKVAGTSAFAAKFLVVGFAVGAVAALVALGQRAGNRAVGLVAGGLLTVSPVHVLNGAHVRDFTPGVFFALFSCYFFLRRFASGELRRQRSDARMTVGYTVASTLALYASYSFLAVLLAQWVWLVAQRSLVLEHLRGWIRAQAVILLAYLPWGVPLVGATLQKVASGYTWKDALAAVPLSQFVQDSLGYFVTIPQEVPLPGAALAFLGGGLLLWATLMLLGGWPARSGMREGGSGVAMLVFLVPVAVMTEAFVVCTFWTPWEAKAAQSRFLLAGLPFFLLLVAGAATAMWSSRFRVVGVLIIASLAALSVMTFKSYPWRPLTAHHRAMVSLLDEQVISQGDALVFNSLDYAGYYQALSRDPKPWYYVITPSPEFLSYLAGDVSAKTAQVLAKAARAEPRALWLILRGGITPGSQPLYDGINGLGYPARRAALTDSLIWAYALPHREQRWLPLDDAIFAELALLTGVKATTSAPPGGAISLTLIWAVTGETSRDLKVFLHLLDSNGKLWAQHDSEPANGASPTSQWRKGEVIEDRRGLLLPNSIPHGSYRMVAGLYDEAGRYPLANGASSVTLGLVDVVPLENRSQ